MEILRWYLGTTGFRVSKGYNLQHDQANMPLGPRMARSRGLAVPKCRHINNPIALGKAQNY